MPIRSQLQDWGHRNVPGRLQRVGSASRSLPMAARGGNPGPAALFWAVPLRREAGTWSWRGRWSKAIGARYEQCGSNGRGLSRRFSGGGGRWVPAVSIRLDKAVSQRGSSAVSTGSRMPTHPSGGKSPRNRLPGPKFKESDVAHVRREQQGGRCALAGTRPWTHSKTKDRLLRGHLVVAGL
jgi:hypothetical protein